MKTIHVVDYGIGNLLSVKRAFEFIGQKVEIAKNQKDIESADYLVLPGVGAFNQCTKAIKDASLWDAIYNHVIKNERPFLGICVGMQMMMEFSNEFGRHNGFGFIKGLVDKIPKDTNNINKIPFIGWKNLIIPKTSSLFTKSEKNPVYFVHSFSARLEINSEILATYKYGIGDNLETEIVAAIGKNNSLGLQFHPEKSSKYGLLILSRFVNL